MSTTRPVASGIETAADMMAFIDAFVATLATMDISAVLVQLPDYGPAAALPYLAQQYDVQGIKGYDLCTTDDQRRALIRNALNIKRTMGTPYSIEQAVISVGYDNAIVTEGTGIYHNGIYRHNGAKRHGGGQWFNFSVEVFYTGDPPSDDRIAMITKLINVYKPTRCVLFDLKFTASP